MSKYPVLCSYGYQINRELARNHVGGRITYLATSLNSNKQIVIKQFCFALAGASWTGFKTYECEIEVLRSLNHPRIPRYLDSFETPEGFYLVQEYKNAPSLAQQCNFAPEEIKQIAVSVLEILVYLQKRFPPIIHRDIKPENILVDEQLNAYLVDFGFARIRGGEVALSSVAAGTPGFIPPEELFNRPLTEASDLYSLGVTLISLLTGTRSVDIGNLIDDNYRLNFKGRVPQLSPRFIWWLKKMVAPNVKERHPNAAVALEVLKPSQVVGSATEQETLVRGTELGMLASGLGLFTVSVVVLLSAYFIIDQQVSWVSQLPAQQQSSSVRQLPAKQSSSVRQLLATRKCVGCNLEDANLEDTNLEGTNLMGANLKYATLRGANLAGANLAGANLTSAKLWDANLKSTNLAGTNLAGTFLGGANLEGANLTSANLMSAYLNNTDLGGANLKRANLKYAYLDVNLGRANLEGANLEGAHLKGGNLVGANLKGTIMPDGTKSE